MFKQTINIVQFPTLHEILTEINDILKFQIINYKDNKGFIANLEKKTSNQKNLTIITNPLNLNLINSKILDERKILTFKELPLKIFEIIEKINIQLIKQKYDFQSNFIVKNYNLNINSRIISNKKKELKLTEKEIDVLLYLNDSKVPQNINNLQNKVWGYSLGLETHTVETHIYRLRKKFNDRFQDKNFILSDDDGYSIK